MLGTVDKIIYIRVKNEDWEYLEETTATTNIYKGYNIRFKMTTERDTFSTVDPFLLNLINNHTDDTGTQSVRVENIFVEKYCFTL